MAESSPPAPQGAQSHLTSRRAAKSRGDFWKVWGPLLALVAIGFALALTRLEPPAPTRFAIAAGAPGGAYHAFAVRYREVLARQGYELVVRETAGSVENLRLLASGEAPLALMQGGISLGDGSGDLKLSSLASLFLEPLWVFHRAERPLGQLRDLAGWRIAVGAPGSGTRELALKLLAANGIDDPAERIELGGVEAAAALEAGEVDAAFFVTSPAAPYVARLLARDDVALLGATRSRAYRLDHPYLSPVTLGEGVVDLAANLPGGDVPLLAAAASLAASPELHHALIPLLLDAMAEIHGSGGYFAPPGTFPSSHFVDLPIAPQAEQYLTRGPSFLYRVLPYRTAATLDRLKILLLPFITLLIPVFKAAPPIYRWRIRSKIYRWYEDLKSIDEDLHGEPTEADLDDHRATLEELEEEVTGVKVPLSYMDEYYRLREHIRLIQRKLEAVGKGRPS